MKDIEGIIFSEQPYSETSKLLKIITKTPIGKFIFTTFLTNSTP